MAVTANLYTTLTVDAVNANHNWSTGTYKVALLTGYTPNQDTDAQFSDVSAFQITGTGYTAGGATMSGLTTALDNATNTWKFKANDVSWASSTLSATHAVIYRSTNTLVGWVDFGGTVTTTGSTFTIAWAGGVVFQGAVA